MSNSKYDIPFSFIDARTAKKEKPQAQAKITELRPVQNQSNHTDLPEINWQMILRWILVGIAQLTFLVNQFRQRCADRFKKHFGDLKLPWFKLSILVLLCYVMFKKDMQFNLAFKSPVSIFSDQEEQHTPKNVYAQSVAAISDVNPYAPVGTNRLLDKNTLDFINEHKDLAISEMKTYGIPASIKMAQALIESRAGDSKLARNNNNFFGMKCFSKRCAKGHCTNAYDDHHKDFFRKYKSPKESWRSHSKLLSQGRYKKLAAYGKDYKKWAKGLKSAGYATDKKYASKLINVIEKYQLYRLDQ